MPFSILRSPLFLLVLFLTSLNSTLIAGPKRSQDWLPVTPADLAIKEVPGAPGAAAVQLYYATYEDHNDPAYEFNYHRIKILNEKGRSYADVEIPFFDNDYDIADLKARTIQPDGSIVEFKGKPYVKTVVKTRGVKFLAKAFTLPEVNVGSIVEYKYKIRWDSSRVPNTSWTLQRDLFTVRASFYFNPYKGQIVTKDGTSQVSYVWNKAAAAYRPQLKDGAAELELQDIPAFNQEEHAPPEAELKPQIRFYYGGAEVGNPAKFWEGEGKEWYEVIESFIGNRKEIREEAQRLVGSEADPEKKLRILYARAQQVRNLSYERERTEQEEKKEKLKDNENAGEVLKRGYAYRWHITRFFVALARAAGFEANAVRVSERDDHFFDINMLSSGQLDGELAVVKLNGKDIYLDPGTRFCPFGVVRWTRTGVAARSLDKKGGSFFTTPPPNSHAAITRRNGELTLDEQGSLKGRIKVELTGQEAMNRRLDALEMDEAGRTKEFEDDLKRWLAMGADVKLEKSTGWDSSEEPLVAEFSVELPGFASAAGKRMLLPTGLFQTQQKNPFAHPDRSHPIYFAYCYQELDNIRIKLPATLALESLPQALDQTFPYGRILTVRKAEGNELILGRGFQMEGILFPIEHYPGVKDFFGKVQSVDEEQAVLRRKDTANVTSSN
jgi:hypothetical protein